MSLMELGDFKLDISTLFLKFNFYFENFRKL